MRIGWEAMGGDGGNFGVHRPAETVRAVVVPPGVVAVPDIDGVEIGRMVSILGGECREDLEVVGTPMYWIEAEGVVNPDIADAAAADVDCDCDFVEMRMSTGGWRDVCKAFLAGVVLAPVTPVSVSSPSNAKPGGLSPNTR